MELTREILEGRLQMLTGQKAQAIANVNACEGGLMILRDLLGDLDRKKPKEKKKK